MRQAPFTMYAALLVLLVRPDSVISRQVKSPDGLEGNDQDMKLSDSDKSYQYVAPPALLTVTPVISQRILTDSTKKYDHGGSSKIHYWPQHSQQYPLAAPLPPYETQKNLQIHTVVDANPLVAALLLSSILGIEPKYHGFNHPEHLPLNPYIALLLSHYGRYVPLHGAGRGIYGYSASNNYHNNKPFGAYKIYEDSDA